MKERSDRIGLLALPGLTFLAVVFALPLVLLLLKSFQIDGAFSIAEYRLFFSDEFNITALVRTLRVAALTTLLALLIAYPTAIALKLDIHEWEARNYKTWHKTTMEPGRRHSDRPLATSRQSTGAISGSGPTQS